MANRTHPISPLNSRNPCWTVIRQRQGWSLAWSYWLEIGWCRSNRLMHLVLNYKTIHDNKRQQFSTSVCSQRSRCEALNLQANCIPVSHYFEFHLKYCIISFFLLHKWLQVYTIPLKSKRPKASLALNLKGCSQSTQTKIRSFAANISQYSLPFCSGVLLSINLFPVGSTFRLTDTLVVIVVGPVTGVR